jgi:very-short-patch-repair endonuclease
MQCGPVRYQVQAKGHEGTQSLAKQVIVRPTDFQSTVPEDPDVRMAYTDLMTELIQNENRNRQIVDDICLAVGQKAHPLVLTERSEHLDWFRDALRQRDIQVVVLQGGMNKGDFQSAMLQTQERTEAHPLVLLATGRFVGEGFDDAALDTLFLTMPISWKGLVAQYVGRLHRLREGKSAVKVYDYADIQVPMLSRMFDKRCRGYESLGYTILLPASAIPGWPVQVPLPVNLDWKRTYAASVHRMVRDGVDIPLAELFIQAACIPIGGGLAGADRARSASEAFLYRRLQSLTETADRFKLNQQIPIPFRGRPAMEVDFLDKTAKWVIELDGAAHFSDVEAYRRDREKDLLLQENGYLVMRFLAEDLTTNLQTVLDTILRGPCRP